MKPGAIFCLECKKYQGQLRAVVSTVTVPIFLTLITSVLGVSAYLKRTVILPRPVITATALMCSRETVTVGLSNTGTRHAVLIGGAAHLVGGNPQVRVLRNASLPLQVAPDHPATPTLTMFENNSSPDPAPMPQRPGPCTLAVNLTVRDFSGKDFSPKAMTCACAS